MFSRSTLIMRGSRLADLLIYFGGFITTTDEGIDTFMRNTHSSNSETAAVSRCQLPCSQNCDTRNFFAQNMPETTDLLKSHPTAVNWLESQSTQVLDVCPSTNGKTIWLESYSTRVTGLCLSTDNDSIRLESYSLWVSSVCPSTVTETIWLESQSSVLQLM